MYIQNSTKNKNLICYSPPKDKRFGGGGETKSAGRDLRLYWGKMEEEDPKADNQQRWRKR